LAQDEMNRSLHNLGRVLVFALLVALPCFATDVAVLRNGFSIRHERRQVIGTITRLYMGGDDSSFVDVPTAEIDHFETLPIEAIPAATTNAASTPQLPASMQTARRPVDIDEVVKTASGNYKLDPDLVSSVIKAESGFNVRAVSPKGAQGLMQLMPQTATDLGVKNVFDPKANVDGGTRYLRELLERYDFDLVKALAAYNAGPQRVEQYGGVPPYYETKAYVARIVRDFNKKKLAQQNAEHAKNSSKVAEGQKPSASAKTKSNSPNSKTRAAAPHDEASLNGSR
jgi:hypothetical protein